MSEQYYDLDKVREEARKQIREENFRVAVEREKERLRVHRSFWQRVCPFVITIRRR